MQDILDIKIFSQMNILVKSNISKNKEELRLIDVTLAALKDKIILQKGHITTLESIQQVGIDGIDAKLSEYSQSLDTNQVIIDSSVYITSTFKNQAFVLKEQKEKRDNVVNSVNLVKNDIKLLEK